jgi:hypothetical protein
MDEQKQEEQKKEEPVKETKELTREIHHHHYHEHHHGFNLGRFLLGLVIVVVGLGYLAKTTGWINLNINFDWANLWPLLIIFIGLSLISFRGWVGAIIGILATLIVLAVVALLVFNVVAPGWNIQGSGKVIQEERQVADFNEISFAGTGNLIIVQTSTESLMIEAEDNIVPRIATRVDDQTLIIEYKWAWPSLWFNPQKPINIYVGVKDLKSIEGSGATNIKSDSIKSDKLKISGSGASKADLSVEVGELDTEISGAGDFIIAGKADEQKIQISGAGKYEAKNLLSKNVELELSGAGLATVNAQEKLDVEVSGAAKVGYLGNPRISQKISGAGKVEKLSE